MDYIKIQADALKGIVNETSYVRYFEQERDILFFPDGFRGYRIPKSLFFLDTGKMKEVRSGEQFFTELPCHVVHDTGILKPMKVYCGGICVAVIMPVCQK